MMRVRHLILRVATLGLILYPWLMRQGRDQVLLLIVIGGLIDFCLEMALGKKASMTLYGILWSLIPCLYFESRLFIIFGGLLFGLLGLWFGYLEGQDSSCCKQIFYKFFLCELAKKVLALATLFLIGTSLWSHPSMLSRLDPMVTACFATFVILEPMCKKITNPKLLLFLLAGWFAFFAYMKYASLPIAILAAFMAVFAGCFLSLYRPPI